MPKILAINNTIFYESKNKLFLNKETGIFFLRLNELGNDVSVFQISHIRFPLEGIPERETEETDLTNFYWKKENWKMHTCNF